MTSNKSEAGNRLSVCMIVRDEERVLQRCIDSLQGIFDQLCIIDTGSSDRTIELAFDNGALVEQFTECNDSKGQIVNFALARNQALRQARCNWILQIDADEILEAGAENICRHMRNPILGQVGVLMYSDGASWISTRLFRNIEGLSYRSKVHEYLAHPGKLVKDPDIRISNLPDKAGKEPADQRNIRLCNLALSEDPTDGRLFHYLGNEYRKQRQFQKAIDAYQAALASKNFTVGQYHTLYYLSVCYLLQENWDLAVDTAMKCLTTDPRYAEAPCLLGDVYSSIGNNAYAIQWYQTALQKTPPSDAVMSIQSWSYEEYPRKRLQKLSELGF